MIELSDSSWDEMLVLIADRAGLNGMPKDAFYLRFKEKNLTSFECQSIQKAVDSLNEWETDFQNYKKHMTEVYRILSDYAPLKFKPTRHKDKPLYHALREHHAQKCLGKRNNHEDCELSLGNILPFIDMKDLVKTFREMLEDCSSPTASFCFPFLFDKKAVLQQMVMSRLIASLPFQAPPMIKEVRVPSHWQDQDPSKLLDEIAQSLKVSLDCMTDELADQALTQPTILVFQDAQHFGDNIEVLMSEFWLPIVDKLIDQKKSSFYKQAMLFLSYKQEMRGIDHYIDFKHPYAPYPLPPLPPLTTRDVSDWVEDQPVAYQCRCQMIENYPNCKGKQIKEWENSDEPETLADDILGAFQTVVGTFTEDQDLLDMKVFFRLNGALVA